MLIAYFDLKEVDIQSLKLNDKIYIDNSWWNINKIQDYNANNNGLTKVELMSIDTEIDLAPFLTGNGAPLGDTITAVGLDSILKTQNQNSNVIMEGSDVLVKGKGNVVTAGTKGIIIGDNQTLSDDGIVTKNLVVTETINGAAVVPYKKYIALISQTGTADPTAIELENTLGFITLSRTFPGIYTIDNVDNLFTIDKTWIVTGSACNGCGGSGTMALVNTRWVSDTQINLYTSDDLTLADDILDKMAIEIRVY